MPAYRRALGSRFPARRRWWAEPKLGHHPRHVEVEVRLGELPAFDFGDERVRLPDRLVRCWNWWPHGGLQRPPVGPERVSFLNDPVTVAERTFPDDMEIGKGLNHRLKACTDCLAAFRWLYVLRVALNDRRKVEAEEALHVVIVESLVPRIQQTDVICHTHLDSPPPLREGHGYSKRAPPRLPSRWRMAAWGIDIPRLLPVERPNVCLDSHPLSDRKLVRFRRTSAPAASSSTEATHLPRLRPLPRLRGFGGGCAVAQELFSRGA